MRASEIAEQRCSIARPAALLGDRWTLVILRQAFNGIKRFEDFQESLGISRSLLSERLARLVDRAILLAPRETAEAPPASVAPAGAKTVAA